MRFERATICVLAGLGFLAVAPAVEAAESKAQSWGLTGEQAARFEATVVDVLCTLSGDCPSDCGAGRRQLGLLRADGVLVLAAKNGQPIFSGAAEDLLPYCARKVEVDGLMVGEGPTRIYQVQTIRALDAPAAHKADRWSKVWEQRHPGSGDPKKPWFRRDPRVQREVERGGYLGLGAEVDRAFIKESQ